MNPTPSSDNWSSAPTRAPQHIATRPKLENIEHLTLHPLPLPVQNDPPTRATPREITPQDPPTRAPASRQPSREDQATRAPRSRTPAKDNAPTRQPFSPPLPSATRLSTDNNALSQRLGLDEPPPPESLQDNELLEFLDGAPGEVNFARRFTFRRLLGEGGMGLVVLVWDKETQEERALKIWTMPGSSAGLSLAEEFRMLSQFRHPSVVSVYDFGKSDSGLSYFTMEYVEGETLTESLGKDFDDDIRRLLIDILQALRVLHSHDILHGDLKPSNVLISQTPNGQKKAQLADFGLASTIRALAPGSLCGTVPYMPPELIQQQPLDPRSDLYSLGALLYQLLTGEVPFTGSTEEILEQHLYSTPIPPSKFAPEIPAWLEELTLRLLAKEPALRYASADDVLQIIEHAQLDEHSSSPKELLYTSQCVGHSEETALFNQLFSQLPARGAGLQLSGPVGVGKSHLLSAWKVDAQLQGALWLQAAPTKEEALSPIPTLLRMFIARCPQQLTPLQQILDILDGQMPWMTQQASRSEERTRLFLHIAQQLASLQLHVPVVFVLEDLQNASDDTRDLLDIIAPSFASSGILWLSALRNDREHDAKPKNAAEHLLQIELGALDRSNSEKLVRAILNPVKGLEEVMGALFQKTGGNPLQLIESLRFLLKEKCLQRTRGSWWMSPDAQKQLPTRLTHQRVEEAFEHRLQGLSNDLLSLLELGSLLGARFPARLLTSTALSLTPEEPWTIHESFESETDVLTQIEQMALQGLWTKEEAKGERWLSFHPSSLSEYVRSEMTHERCDELHGRIAWELHLRKEQGEEIDDIQFAHHAIQSRLELLTSTLILNAEEHFLRSCASAEGHRFFSQLAERLEEAERHIEAAIAWEKAAGFTSDLRHFTAQRGELMKALHNLEYIGVISEGTTDHTREAISLLSSGEGFMYRHITARLLCKLGRCLDSLGEHEHSLVFFRRGLCVLPTEEDFEFGEFLVWQHSMPLAGMQRLEENSLLLLRAKLWHSIGWSLMMLGRYDEARQAAQQALEEARQAQEVPALCQTQRLLAGIAFYQEDRACIEEAALESLSLATRSNDPRGEAEAQFVLGNFRNLQEHYAEAAECFLKAHEIFHSLGLFAAEGRSLNNLGVSHYLQGNWEQAIEAWEQFASVCERLGNRDQQVKALNNFAFLYKDRGSLHQAHRTLEQAIKLAKADGLERFEVTLRGNLGEVFFRMGKYQQAKEELLWSKQRAEELQAPLETCENTRRLIELELSYAPHNDQLSQIHASMLIVRHHNYRSEEAHLLRLEGLYHLHNSLDYLAVESLQNACDLFHKLDARYEEAQTWTLLSQALFKTGDPQQAQQLRKDATKRFQALGAAWDLEKLHLL